MNPNKALRGKGDFTEIAALTKRPRSARPNSLNRLVGAK